MSGVSLLMSHDDDLKAGMADVSYIVAGSCVRACARRGRCQGELEGNGPVEPASSQ